MPFSIVSYLANASLSLFLLSLVFVNGKTLPYQYTQSLKKLKARDKRIADLQAAVEEATASASAPSNAAAAATEQQVEAAAARAEALEAKLKVRVGTTETCLRAYIASFRARTRPREKKEK